MAVFGDTLDYSLYGSWDRRMLRLIMRPSGGPTEGDTEDADWRQVETFGRHIGQMEPHCIGAVIWSGGRGSSRTISQAAGADYVIRTGTV